MAAAVLVALARLAVTPVRVGTARLRSGSVRTALTAAPVVMPGPAARVVTAVTAGRWAAMVMVGTAGTPGRPVLVVPARRAWMGMPPPRMAVTAGPVVMAVTVVMVVRPGWPVAAGPAG
jgi:hypothetical protein